MTSILLSLLKSPLVSALLKGTEVIEEYLNSQDPWLRTTLLHIAQRSEHLDKRAARRSLTTHPS